MTDDKEEPARVVTWEQWPILGIKRFRKLPLAPEHTDAAYDLLEADYEAYQEAASEEKAALELRIEELEAQLKVARK